MRFSFAFKIGIAINLTLIPTISFAGWFFYDNASEMIISLMSDRLKDVVKTGSFFFDKEDRKKIKKLRLQVLNDLSRKSIGKEVKDLPAGDYLNSLPNRKEKAYMAQGSFKSIVQKLRQIKEASRKKLRPLNYLKQISPEEEDYPVIQYTYLLVSFPEVQDKSILMFLADADYEAVGDEEGNPIGNIYKVKQDAFISAFSGEVASEQKFISDEWGTWLSGAAPIVDENGQVIAILGVDYDVASEANKLETLFYIILIVISLSIILGIIISILIARWLSKPIDKLRIGSESVAQRNFDTQINVKSKDELGLLANTFNSMVREIKSYSSELEYLNEVYFRFVPKNFLDNLGLENIVDIKLGDQIQKEMTVLFSDIRSFTTISEKMEPDEVFNFMNSYLSVVGPIIRKYNGFIDKYIGDAIMALFPNPVDALQAAIAMRRVLKEFNMEKKDISHPSINMGIGISSGKLMLGTVGEEQRMETTVIADVVNVASRLESYTKKLQANILISEKTYKDAQMDPASFPFRCLGEIKIRGKEQSLRVYQLLVDVDDNLEIKKKTKAVFEQGVDFYMRKKFNNAASNFERVCGKDESDKVSLFYLNQAKKMSSSS